MHFSANKIEYKLIFVDNSFPTLFSIFHDFVDQEIHVAYSAKEHSSFHSGLGSYTAIKLLNKHVYKYMEVNLYRQIKEHNHHSKSLVSWKFKRTRETL